jgi:hypothetical protein
MTITQMTRRQQRQTAAALHYLEAQRPKRDFASLASIDERIIVASRRCEAIRRQLLGDGAQWLPNREALRDELSRLEAECGALYAQKRAAMAAIGVTR